MPRPKRTRNQSARREAPQPEPSARHEPPQIPPLALWLIREILPLMRHRRRPSSQSAKHLRNAGIEVLEAMRAFLDDAIEWLRKEEGESPMKRIEVED